MGVTEKRIQIYLPESDYKRIADRARAEGKSIAQFLREAAAFYLKRGAAAELREGYRSLLDGAGACRDDRGDVSVSHDRDLGETRW